MAVDDKATISEDDFKKLGSLHECTTCQDYFPLQDMRHGGFRDDGKKFYSSLYCIKCINEQLGILSFE